MVTTVIMATTVAKSPGKISHLPIKSANVRAFFMKCAEIIWKN